MDPSLLKKLGSKPIGVDNNKIKVIKNNGGAKLHMLVAHTSVRKSAKGAWVDLIGLILKAEIMEGSDHVSVKTLPRHVLVVVDKKHKMKVKNMSFDFSNRMSKISIWVTGVVNGIPKPIEEGIRGNSVVELVNCEYEGTFNVDSARSHLPHDVKDMYAAIKTIQEIEVDPESHEFELEYKSQKYHFRLGEYGYALRCGNMNLRRSPLSDEYDNQPEKVFHAFKTSQTLCVSNNNFPDTFYIESPTGIEGAIEQKNHNAQFPYYHIPGYKTTPTGEEVKIGLNLSTYESAQNEMLAKVVMEGILDHSNADMPLKYQCQTSQYVDPRPDYLCHRAELFEEKKKFFDKVPTRVLMQPNFNDSVLLVSQEHWGVSGYIHRIYCCFAAVRHLMVPVAYEVVKALRDKYANALLNMPPRINDTALNALSNSHNFNDEDFVYYVHAESIDPRDFVDEERNPKTLVLDEEGRDFVANFSDTKNLVVAFKRTYIAHYEDHLKNVWNPMVDAYTDAKKARTE